ESTATYAVFNFATREKGGTSYTLKNEAGESVGEYTPANDFSYMIISSEKLVPGTYTLWCDDKQLAASATGAMGGFGGGRPGGMGGRPGGFPEGFTPGERPEGDVTVFPEGEPPQRPDGEIPEIPEGFPGNKPQNGRGQGFGGNAKASTEIVIAEGGNYFNVVSEYTA
ncbi:MAG: hypothetical protein IJZ20_00170, partial [Clostridia bacterium]|nr:hypothetical protein [Clostridia bacterium]